MPLDSVVAAFHFVWRVLPRVLVLLSTSLGAAFASPGPTVQDVVQFNRIVHPRYENPELLRQQVSPDGLRSFIVTRHADVHEDNVRYELLMLDLDPARLLAGRPLTPQRLLEIDGSKEHDYDGWQHAFLQDVGWMDDRTITLRARVHDAPYQVYKLDVATKRLTQLTFEPLGVLSFALSSDLRRVVYVSPSPNPAMPPASRSVVVANKSFWSVMFGQNNLRMQVRRYVFKAAESGSRKPARQLGDSVPEVGGIWPRVSIAPDGRWAVLPVPVPERQVAWTNDYPFVGQQTSSFGPAAKRDPLRYFTPPSWWVPRRMVAYRLSDGKAQVVVDAPGDAPTGLDQQRPDRLWQKDSKSVLVAGTFLPPDAHGEGTRRDASHIIEYWPDTQQWKVVAILKGRLGSIFRLTRKDERFGALDGDTRRCFERQVDGTWREASETAISEWPAGAGDGAAAWTLRIDQGLNQPPDVVAVGPSGQTVRLTDLNPQFSRSTWGTMKPYSWKDAKGRQWDGGLMVPGDFDPKLPHALVIQTYGFSSKRFYLDGSNTVDGFSSGFAGRAFMRENILVLAMPTDPTLDPPSEPRPRIQAFVDGVQAAIRSLVGDGFVDRDRIGIMGWSMTGESVLNLVTFSDAPIRAATLLDGDANTIFSTALTYAFNDETQFRKESTNEGGPYGETLANWVRNDPSLHTDCMHAALRIETYGPAVLNNWDIYAWLRRQYKPVEMVVIPGGMHALGRPSERMISLQGNVDWYRFWLKNEERSEVFLPDEAQATLKQQYERWRQMVDLKRIDDGRLRCPGRVAP